MLWKLREIDGDQPVFVVILGPELAKMLKRGSNNCESLRPHEFGEEGRDASKAIAISTVRGTSCFLFLVTREREECLPNPLNVLEEAHGYGMVHHLVRSPSYACMVYQL